MYPKIELQLREYWNIVVLSTPKIALSLVILLIFIGVATGTTILMRKRLLPRATNMLAVRYVTRLVKVGIITIGIILGLNVLGFDDIAGGLLAGAGVGAVVIGFAFREIGENFLAGIILLFDSPFRVGDTVTSGSNMGEVRMLNFRTTHLKTFDGKDVYVPNSQIINSELYNHTQDGLLRHEFVIGIDYNDDIDKAVQIIIDLVNKQDNILKNEATQVLIDEFGTNTVNLKVLFWVNTIDYKLVALQLKHEIMKEVKNALLREGFGMPANIQELKMYKSSSIPIQVEMRTNETG